MNSAAAERLAGALPGHSFETTYFSRKAEENFFIP
jgi:hypothetical protein